MKKVLLVAIVIGLFVGVQGCKEKPSTSRGAFPSEEEYYDWYYKGIVPDYVKPKNDVDVLIDKLNSAYNPPEQIDVNNVRDPFWPGKEWADADIYELQLLKEEISALQRIVDNTEGKWNVKMRQECQIELQQKEVALEALHKKYQ